MAAFKLAGGTGTGVALMLECHAGRLWGQMFQTIQDQAPQALKCLEQSDTAGWAFVLGPPPGTPRVDCSMVPSAA
jgi:hypothetical protein